MLTGHQSPPRAPFPASLCFLGAPTDTRTDRHRHQHSWHPASLTSLTPIKPHAVFPFHYICCFLGYFLPSPPREGSCQTPSCRRRFPFSSDQLLLLFLKLFQMMTWLASWTEATALTRRKVSTGLRVGLHPQPEAQGPRPSHGASQMRSAPSAVVGKGSRDPPMDLKGSGGSAMPPTPAACTLRWPWGLARQPTLWPPSGDTKAASHRLAAGPWLVGTEEEAFSLLLPVSHACSWPPEAVWDSCPPIPVP